MLPEHMRNLLPVRARMRPAFRVPDIRGLWPGFGLWPAWGWCVPGEGCDVAAPGGGLSAGATREELTPPHPPYREVGAGDVAEWLKAAVC